MKYIEGNDFKISNTCVAFGNFDGVHKGHRAVIDKLLEISKQGFTSAIVSYEYNEKLLSEKKILTTEAEKQYLISKIGPEVLISYKIDECNMEDTPEHFIKEVLVDKLGVKVVVAGADDRNIHVLRACAKVYGFELVECNTVLADGEPITSERIIGELAEGSLQKANELLGHSYLLMGEVVHGKALGRTVGMPTANIDYKQFKQLPAFGVYGTITNLEGKRVQGSCNIGKRPSVDSYNYATIENYLFEFSSDIYGKTVILELHVYIREVEKFNNLDEVKAQVNKDIESIKAYFNTYNHC